MISTLAEMFSSTFSKKNTLKLAKKVGAVKRLRNIHPGDLCLSLTQCAMGDETRSIATARRTFATLTGFTPEESSFYDRFTDELTILMKELFYRALMNATHEQREVIAAALGNSRLLDIEAIDASQITLPASAKEIYPSTHDEHGGIKLTATLSVLYQSVTSIHITEAKKHDRKALKLDRWLHNRLLLLDRGYADHKLWATIEDRRGYFLTPLKSSTMPILSKVRLGVDSKDIGQELVCY